jgi:hypothetical protein
VNQGQAPTGDPANNQQTQPVTNAAPVAPAPVVTHAAPATPAPSDATPSSDVSGLQAELQRWKQRAERSEGVIADMTARPTRSGLQATGMTVQQINPGFGAENAWKSLAARSREEGHVALPVVVDRASEALADEQLASRSTHQLSMLLAQGLNAAEADGLLVAGSQHTSWAG